MEIRVSAFGPYRPDGYTADRAVQNLQDKLSSEAFRHDLDLLVTQWPENYDIDSAAQLVMDQVLRHV